MDSGLTVKVADFGRSRSINYSQYYRQDDKGVMPIRWMAPEALMDGRFSHKGDVWSFGVVLWEIVTFGQIPYPGMSNQEVFEKVSTIKFRMDQVRLFSFVFLFFVPYANLPPCHALAAWMP